LNAENINFKEYMQIVWCEFGTFPYILHPSAPKNKDDNEKKINYLRL